MKSRILGKVVVSLGVVVLGMGLAATSSHALSLTPADADWGTDQTSNCDAACVSALTGISGLTELYKDDVGGGESGTLAGSYSTQYFNEPTEPADFTITYGAGAYASCPECILVVKDGNQENSPEYSQYLFDLGAWNGTESIVGEDFWLSRGAISHVAIYGKETATSVPEPTTLLLIGSGLLGLGLWGASRQKKLDHSPSR